MAGRHGLLQEQFWLMSTCVNLSREAPNPITVNSSETPVVGDTLASNPGELLGVTHLEAALSHMEMIVHCLIPCTGDSWAGLGSGMVF